MDAQAIIRRMERFPAALAAAVAIVNEEEARFKPPSGAWCILEIVCHLVDEERDDFGARLRSVVEDPARKWPPTDPEEWARTRGYMERDLKAMVLEFTQERARTIQWLRSLRGTDWSVAYQHPKIGPVYAGELLTAWGAHDALHLRQIAKRVFELAARDGAPHPTRYAGEWGA